MIVEDAPFTPYHSRRANSRRAKQAVKNFIAWDGEGITPSGESRQNFVLFGNSEGFVRKGTRLSTEDCLSLIIDSEEMHPDAINVGFAFSYDVEMILGDLPIKALQNLRRSGNTFWHGYRIEYKKSKWFAINKTRNGKKISCKIWDVWGFFQSSFLAAVKDAVKLPEDEFARLSEGKAGRAQFSYDDLESGYIEKYWRTELKLTVQMMNELRDRLYGADLKINHWHGPGAIATYALKTRGIENAMNKSVPYPVNDAAQYAYAGGRFELFRAGHHDGPVYAYDIRSAYPSAIVDLPDLSNGTWSLNHNVDPNNLARVGVYRIRFSSRSLMSPKPMPFFYRDDKHRIHFPNVCEGWYWTPEAELAAFMPGDATILYGWEYSESDARPFAWVGDVYNTRAEWKRNGNPSQMALKLLLNSLYGKTAQRVGHKDGKSPKWHQLEWAGFVTSTARAKIFRAMLASYKRGALLGVETDGIFSTQPLPLDIGPGLGQWELTEYERMVYLQSGFYFKQEQGSWSAKYRGFDKGCISPEQTLEVLRKWKPWQGEQGIISGTTTRFSTMGYYLNTKEPDSNRNRWSTSPRTLNIGGDGKRVHRKDFCAECKAEISPADKPHTLTISNPIGGMSKKHVLPWLTEDENQFRTLDEEGLKFDDC